MFIRYIVRQAVLLLCFVYITLGMAMSYAHAQKAEETDTFSFRAEPAHNLSSLLVEPFDYPGAPIAFGSFKIWPNLTLRQEYTDNVFGVSDDKESDFVTIIEPEISFQRNVGRHNFFVKLDSEIRQYWDQKDENVENYNALFKGNIEVLKKLNFPLLVKYTDGHAKRAGQKKINPNLIPRTPLHSKNLLTEAGVVYSPNRVKLSLTGTYAQLRLDNAPTPNGGLILRDNRNLNETGIRGEAIYNLYNGLSPFISGSFAHQGYINPLSGSPNRNNDTVNILSGFKLNYKELLNGSIGIGIEDRSYDDSSLDNIGNLAIDAAIEWEPTAKTRLGFTTSRSTSEDNLLVSGVTTTTVGTTIQHEFQRDIFGRAFINYSVDNFTDLDREDTQIKLGFETLKIINPRLQIGVGYSYIGNDSTVDGLDIGNNTLFLTAKTSF